MPCQQHSLFIRGLRPSGKELHDIRWARTMDVAIALAALAIKHGLSASVITRLNQEYVANLPPADSACRIHPDAISEIINWSIRPHTPWTAKQVCHFILAGAHRSYAVEHNSDKWQASHFKCVPVGIPRTINRTPGSRNYTSYKSGSYKAYLNRINRGVAKEFLQDLSAHSESSAVTGRLVELTETTDEYWMHTRIQHLETIWAHVSTLASRALHAEVSGEIVKLLVAQIHWWLAQAMPYRRGSAAVADMFVRSIYSSRGETLPRWKAGLAPDLEALCSSLSQYCDNYFDFFEWPPENAANVQFAYL